MQAVSLSGSRKCRAPTDNAIKSYASKDAARPVHVIDGKGLELGQLTREVAKLLRGRHKPIFTPNADVGDYVVIVNAALVQLTGNKRQQNPIYLHMKFPGGRSPEKLVERAVLRMLPTESPFARAAMKRLRVYAGPNHPHKTQQAKFYDFVGKSGNNVVGSPEMISKASQGMEAAAEKVARKYFEKSKSLIEDVKEKVSSAESKLSAMEAGQAETNERLRHLEEGQKHLEEGQKVTNELLGQIRDILSRSNPSP